MLTPLAVGPGQPFPYISGLSLCLGVLVRDPETGEERFARVKVPETLPRFVEVGERGLLLPLEERDRPLPRLALPGDGDRRARRLPRHARRRLRGLRRGRRPARGRASSRSAGAASATSCALEVSSSMSRRDARPARRRASARSTSQVYPIDGHARPRGPDGDRDARPARAEGRALAADHAGAARPRRAAAASSSPRSARGDILVHHPVRLVRDERRARSCGAPSSDPDVIALKTTVYRTSDDSPVVPALDRGRRGGQAERLPRRAQGALRRAPQHRVVARARAGGRPRRLRLPQPQDPREDDARRPARGRPAAPLRPHRHRATTTRVTARLYEDFGLFTADEDIAADVADLFNYLTGFGRPQRFRKLLVAPFNLRARGSSRRSARSAAAAADGKRARIRLKVNALTDQTIIEELYAASQDGRPDRHRRPLHLLAPPGRSELSETISVRSVVGRFLEHSRVFVFEAGDRERLPDRQRRPDAAQPRPPDRDRRAGRGRAGQPELERDPRRAARRQRAGVGARAGRDVDAAPSRRRSERLGRRTRR